MKRKDKNRLDINGLHFDQITSVLWNVSKHRNLKVLNIELYINIAFYMS